MWQGGKQRSPMGLIRSRGKNGLHTGLLHHIAPACPSEYFHVTFDFRLDILEPNSLRQIFLSILSMAQQVIRNVLTDDEDLCSVFMNSVLTQLNWAFTEFILFVQEVRVIDRK